MKTTYKKSINLISKFVLLTLSCSGKVSLANDSKMHQRCLKENDYERCMNKANLNEKCLKAADYEGCMEYSKGIQNSEINSIDFVDCSQKYCTPEEAKGQVDNLGMKVIPGWKFFDMPAKRGSGFTNPEVYKVRVNNQFGRYINLKMIIRYYQEPQAATPGYSSSIGGGSTNCYGVGSSISCYTTPPTQLNIPGRAAVPGGIVQENYDYILDCEDEVWGKHLNERLIKAKNNKGKLRKWVKFSETDDNFVKYTGMPFCKDKKELIEYLQPSTFSLYKYKDIKKRTSSKSKNVGNINCDSPVWKNKPRCN